MRVQPHAQSGLKFMRVVKRNVDLLFFLWPHGPEEVRKNNEKDRNKARLV